MQSKTRRDFRSHLGARIRQLRKAQDLTQEALADRAGMEWRYLGSVERGERNITIDNVERIVRALGVEPYEPFLFSLKEAKAPEKADEEALVNLVRHTDRAVRPLVVSVVHTLLRWHGRRK